MTNAQYVSVQWGLLLFVAGFLPQLLFWRRGLLKRGAVTLYVSMLLAAVFLPPGGTPSQAVQLVPFQWVSDVMTDGAIAFEQMLLNVLLFVPLGFFLARLGKAQTIALGFVTTLAIETAQLTIGHRIFDVDDLITNTAGVALGYALMVAFRSLKATISINSDAHRVPDGLRLEVGAQAGQARLVGEVLSGRAA